jgi:hypothetical protein
MVEQSGGLDREIPKQPALRFVVRRSITHAHVFSRLIPRSLIADVATRHRATAARHHAACIVAYQAGAAQQFADEFGAQSTLQPRWGLSEAQGGPDRGAKLHD